MTRFVCVMSGKGGVGKTSVAVMLAQILSEEHKTVIIDFDICGPSVCRALGVNGPLIKSETGFNPVHVKDNLYAISFGSILKPDDAVIWRGAKKLIFLELFYNSAVNFDFVVIDTPPGISEEHEFLINKGIEMLAVTTPQNIALNDTQRCIEFCKINKIEILGLIENMSYLICEKCDQIHHPFGHNSGKQLADEYSLDFLGSMEIEPEWADMLDSGTFKNDYKKLKAYPKIKNILTNLKIIGYDQYKV